MSVRRGGIPGPESRTGLVRPAMSEAEFERRQQGAGAGDGPDRAAPAPTAEEPPVADEPEPAPRAAATGSGAGGGGSSGRSRGSSRSRAPAKPRRVQRMFAIEEELDKKLWLYAIHVGKDRSEVVNDLLRPLVSSMVLYDSRDRRSSNSRSSDADTESPGD